MNHWFTIDSRLGLFFGPILIYLSALWTETKNIFMKISWGDVVAIYAAIVSSLVACIELFRVVREMRSKLVIDLSVYTEDSIDEKEKVTSQKIIRVNIVNHSASDRVITQHPWLNLDTSQSRIAPPVEIESPFPRRLLPGDACEFLYNFKSIQVWAKESAASKVRASIDDTYGKNYKSKWAKI